MNGRVLAVDVGNSTATAGLVDPAGLRCVSRCSCETVELEKRLAECVESLFERTGAQPTLAVRVSNVVPSKTQAIAQSLAGIAGATKPVWVSAHDKLPLKLNYKQPHLLGADRIANCLYANAAYPRQNVVVIDSGSAVTIDCVSADGGFVGGAILPGVDVQLASLNSAGAQLPLVRAARARPPFPGTSTEECMLSGVQYGIAGALDRLVGRFQEAFGRGAVTILACGGKWPEIEESVTFRYTHVPDLTLVGAALFQPSRPCD